MVTDPLFYRFFATSPETFFLLLGMDPDLAKAMAGRYEFDAIEFKETSHRSDGVFRPKEPELPLYFLEVQFYRLPEVYAGILAKAYTYLKLHDPNQLFHGVVLFATKAMDPGASGSYQPLIDAGVLKRFYLDQLPEIENAPLGLSILSLLRQSEDQAPARARELVARTKSEIADEVLRNDLIQLIETVIIYKLANLSREEIQAMLHVDDIRKTRVYREAKEEGQQEARQEERERQYQEKLRAIQRMAALKIAPLDIANILELDVEVVREQIAKNGAPK
jgi:predicted transposase/invertase (TIGR01784 family)